MAHVDGGEFKLLSFIYPRQGPLTTLSVLRSQCVGSSEALAGSAAAPERCHQARQSAGGLQVSRGYQDQEYLWPLCTAILLFWHRPGGLILGHYALIGPGRVLSSPKNSRGWQSKRQAASSATGSGRASSRMPSTGAMLAAFIARRGTCHSVSLRALGSSHNTQTIMVNMRVHRVKWEEVGEARPFPRWEDFWCNVMSPVRLLRLMLYRWLISTIVANHRASTVTCGAGLLRLQREQPPGREA